MYLDLRFGHDFPGQQLDGWGFKGPIMGPLPYVTVTFAEDVGIGENRFLPIVSDLLVYDGKYYGDWRLISAETLTALSATDQARIKSYSANAIS